MPPITPIEKKFKDTIDYKSKQIKKFSDNKEKAIMLMSCGRDAVLMVTNNTFTMQQSVDFQAKEIKRWRRWFFYELYGVEPDVELMREERNKPDAVPFV